MAENRTVTGSKDDLLVDASRCLLMRFSESSCRRCFDICPHGAVSVDGGLSINPHHCRGCLLCTAVCPVGALEQSSDFSACLDRLSKVPEPVLGCVRTNERSNGTVACLGGLSEEHLVDLCHTLPEALTLNASLCADCTNKAIIPHLRLFLVAVSHAGLTAGGCHIDIAESAQDIKYRDESVDRRSFFKSVRNSLFKSADIILSNTNSKTERRSAYAVKRVPVRRALLNSIRNKLSHELESRLRKHFDSWVSFEATCTSCKGCVAICPTGALVIETTEERPQFDRLLCTGCGLCEEFCLYEALRIHPLSYESD